MTTTDQVGPLADKLIEFLTTGTAPPGLFTPDVFCDLSMPSWRLQAVGIDQAIALRKQGYPEPTRVPRHRLDATASGFVLEVEEEWEQGSETWYTRELFRADVTEGAIARLSIYCTGSWDQATRRRHAATVHLARP